MSATNITININKLDELDDALDVSLKVYKPSPDEIERYHNRSNWLEKINNNGLLITAKVKDMVVGFSICCPREGKFHIWNVGVLDSYRKSGVWKQMYDTVQKFAKKNNFKQLTLNTYRSKFPNMYFFCLSRGFIEYKTEKGKSYFIKDIP